MPRREGKQLPTRPYALESHNNGVLVHIQTFLQLSDPNFIFTGEFHANVEFLRQSVTLGEGEKYSSVRE